MTGFFKKISRITASLMIVLFGFNMLYMPVSYAQVPFLPTAGVMVNMTGEFNPIVIKGMQLYPDNPFKFDFIVDTGDTHLSQDGIKEEGQKLIAYFLASLTTPEKEMWVNLSPYEKDRIIPKIFGETQMGKELLAQDYLLKQIMATALYPERELGRQFWQKVYSEAQEKFGTTNVPVSTFNKVWILPDKAVVYENSKMNSVFVVESSLKVMLEQDYLAAKKNQRQPGDMFSTEQQKNVSPSTLPNELGLNVKALQGNNRSTSESVSALGSQIIRAIVIPALQKEVNEGKNFAPLRQVYQSLILAAWYKKNLKDNVIAKAYVDRNKIKGVDVVDKDITQKIYQQYLKAYRRGVYNYIKEDLDPATQSIIPRKYFSGGLTLNVSEDLAMTTDQGWVGRIFGQLMGKLVRIKAGAEPFGQGVTAASEIGVSFPRDKFGRPIIGRIVPANLNPQPSKLSFSAAVTRAVGGSMYFVFWLFLLQQSIASTFPNPTSISFEQQQLGSLLETQPAPTAPTEKIALRVPPLGPSVVQKEKTVTSELVVPGPAPAATSAPTPPSTHKPKVLRPHLRRGGIIPLIPKTEQTPLASTVSHRNRAMTTPRRVTIGERMPLVGAVSSAVIGARSEVAFGPGAIGENNDRAMIGKMGIVVLLGLAVGGVSVKVAPLPVILWAYAADVVVMEGAEKGYRFLFSGENGPVANAAVPTEALPKGDYGKIYGGIWTLFFNTEGQNNIAQAIGLRASLFGNRTDSVGATPVPVIEAQPVSAPLGPSKIKAKPEKPKLKLKSTNPATKFKPQGPKVAGLAMNGGIDLGKVNVNALGGGVRTAFSNADQLRMLLNADGLVPVIYKIQPMTVPMMNMLLGFNVNNTAHG